ncbi:hypothetical protein HPG69_004234, partial [Diceros bicornis minor]
MASISQSLIIFLGKTHHLIFASLNKHSKNHLLKTGSGGLQNQMMWVELTSTGWDGERGKAKAGEEGAADQLHLRLWFWPRLRAGHTETSTTWRDFSPRHKGGSGGIRNNIQILNPLDPRNEQSLLKQLLQPQTRALLTQERVQRDKMQTLPKESQDTALGFGYSIGRIGNNVCLLAKSFPQ